MAQYRTFGSFILFHETADDEIGHLYRAGEIARGAVGRTVWLRVFDAVGVPRADVTERLETGSLVGQHLHAANVADGPQCFAADGVPAVAWDYAAGQPLSEVFARVQSEGFPVPVDNALLILEKLALALSAALAVDLQGSALIHGFLHPGMVVVSTDGEAVVYGFGLAEQLLGVLDHPDTAARCASYLAPEVLVARSSSKRGDVYSLGAILYQLLTNEPLPTEPGERIAALEGAQLAFDEGPIPADIMGLLRRALASRPEERFSSAADFKKELDKLLYGGAYSPTTFNLALFMDRLFRSDIETEERARLAESEVDVTPYLRPEPEPEEEVVTAAPARGGGRGLWIGLAAVALLLGAGSAYLFLSRGREPAPVLAPTPTAEQLAAKRDAEQKQLEAMVQEQVAQLMAEKEASIRKELTVRQDEIEKLQGRLKAMQSKSTSSGEVSAEQRAAQQKLKEQLAAAEEAKRKQEAALQQERQKKMDELRQKLTVPPTATPAPAAAPTVPAAASVAPTATSVAPAATAAVPAPQPTATPASLAPAEPTPIQVTENMFFASTEVDTRPAVLKEYPVSWPRVALFSQRRGVVIVQATVNADGRVDDVKVLRADDEGFGIPEAAMEAVRKYLFRPAIKNGVRVKTTASVALPYAFRRR